VLWKRLQRQKIFAVDDSKKSKKAAKKVEELVISPGTEITILHVVTSFNLIDDPRFEVEDLLEEIKNNLKEKGKQVLNQTEVLLKDVLTEKEVKIKKY